MPRIPGNLVKTLFEEMNHSSNPTEQGNALENFMCDFFSFVPGIVIAERNVRNAFRTEEVDIALWNDQEGNGFRFLPNNLIVECKNWSSRVGSSEISYFGNIIRDRGLDHGFFIAMNGITGNSVVLSDAHSIIASFLHQKIKIIVLDIEDLKTIKHSDDLIFLIKCKITQLHASGTIH